MHESQFGISRWAPRQPCPPLCPTALGATRSAWQCPAGGCCVGCPVCEELTRAAACRATCWMLRRLGMRARCSVA
jgi:hypothetical protein